MSVATLKTAAVFMALFGVWAILLALFPEGSKALDRWWAKHRKD